MVIFEAALHQSCMMPISGIPVKEKFQVDSITESELPLELVFCYVMTAFQFVSCYLDIKVSQQDCDGMITLNA